MTGHESVTRTSDPTKAVLSKSSLWTKYLQDYVVNVATGCMHGCTFCYVPSTPNIRMRGDMLSEEANVDDGQKEWGDYVLYRDGLGDRLDGHLDRKRTWDHTRSGQGIVGISYSTDPFQDQRSGDISARCVEALANHDRYARVQTRNPMLASNYMDTFQAAGEHVTVGSSGRASAESHRAASAGADGSPRGPTPICGRWGVRVRVHVADVPDDGQTGSPAADGTHRRP